MSEALRVLDDLTRQLRATEEAGREIPEATPRGEARRLCVGMATYDDFDGVWFTVQAIRLYHPEVLDQVCFLVLDNHPEGPAAAHLKALDAKLPEYRYVPHRAWRGTAARDLIFRETDSELVLCVDSHVLLRPGALRALLDHFEADPDSRDLVQGPLWRDDLSGPQASHMEPTWGAGMYGRWELDDRARDPAGPAFEIGMQGLGAFACRRRAWPGLNPRLRGFGGEEGYLHDKVRRAGGRVLCLPPLGWAHRFSRPAGVPYAPTWGPRVRNYMVARRELGQGIDDMVAHLVEEFGERSANELVEAASRDLANPFDAFDAIVCVSLDSEPARWPVMRERFEALGIEWRVERHAAVETPDGPQRGRALTLRAVVAGARRRGLGSVLVIEDDAVFLDTTLAVLSAAVHDLRGVDWDVLYLGGATWGREPAAVEGAAVLRRAEGVTGTHAVAIRETAFDAILAGVPDGDGRQLAAWLDENGSVDQHLAGEASAGRLAAYITEPRLASQPALLSGESSDLALASRFTI